MMLIFRQLFDPQSSTYTYLVGDGRTREAVLIDPVFEQARRDDARCCASSTRSLFATVDTHVHADHVTGAWLLKQQFGSAIALSAPVRRRRAPIAISRTAIAIAFGRRYLEVRATPGHTKGCVTLVLDDESAAFTGDCLLIRGSGRPISSRATRARCTARCAARS